MSEAAAKVVSPVFTSSFEQAMNDFFDEYNQELIDEFCAQRDICPHCKEGKYNCTSDHK